MRIKLIAVGTRMPGWVEEGYGEYAKRLPRGDMVVELVELALAKRGKNADIARAMEAEGEAIIGAIGKGDRVIALDVLGRSFSTETLADKLSGWRMDGQDVSLLIGGPDGLSAKVLALADEKWSLSALTLPHPLVRVLLMEQLYRAWTVLNNHPYHK
ncbi:23S rRNA (pseudouridine(1915)-N(3))-methyltransferase RlmH [Gilvimarinus sp. SDUM040013]|uniref:Ribosomal RNA large subunit methyltransferase H n=1 Tax=Gilvimarinus gilvus TaxID=3058038 RepID=A0ABU4RWL0_9GAMM|nr:23S rRNA (pseudouridine(1915)-N(3))-methyltransferase RlmH [Gilvimarinus sp. SDUM040013]MDO3385287.1 23S rRNA (pseudouridine(1915)-N(3))-methyltransferase RlmH [Gilvimarinus sp. SDUM040013]MDX6849270.1 23S rRNA (pseudouridine(1915)-N(3))-methyltransferase RlmH [Gilvimarinus sp. SDUM040013]